MLQNVLVSCVRDAASNEIGPGESGAERSARPAAVCFVMLLIPAATTQDSGRTAHSQMPSPYSLPAKARLYGFLLLRALVLQWAPDAC